MNVIGLDIGTTTVSAIVLDSASGALLASRTIPNGADLPADVPGGSLQDADVIIGKLTGLLDELRAAYAPIGCIGIDGQMHGLLYVDGDGHAISPLYTWQDDRGSLPYDGDTYSGTLSKQSGCAMSSGFGLTTHFWMTLNDRIPARAKKLCSIFDYAAMKLTGRTTPLMHASGAASFGLFDLYAQKWMTDTIARCGMDTAYLPEVTVGYATVGVTRDGIPVSCGIGDNQASFIGSIRDLASSVLVNMGTGGQVSMAGFMTAPIDDLEMRPIAGDRYLIAGSTLCGGRAYAMLEKFVYDVAALTGYDGERLYEAMNRVARGADSINDAWKIDTRFGGSRRQPELRGAIGNIGVDNFDVKHLICGVIEGVADEIMDLYAKMPREEGRPVTALIGSGNGLRKNAALRKAFERRFGLPMMIPAHNEEAAFGAALYGMVAAGIVPSLEDAQKLIRYE